jgi:Tfp pilus assembly PilM family ATPase
MNEFQRCAGINLTASKLQFVEIEKVNNLLLINNAGQTFVSPPIIFKEQDETFIKQQLQAAFDELKIRNSINSNLVSFTLPPELFITLQLPYDENLSQAEVREEFNWEISQLFPFINIEDLAIKFYELDSSLLPAKRNALVVALHKKYLLLFKNFCSKNNLAPRLVDNASITANSFINNFNAFNKSVIIHLFNAKDSITLFINVSSKPAYVKVFPKQNVNYINGIIEEFSKDIFKGIANSSSKSAILSGEDLEGDLLSEIGRGTELIFEKFNPFEVIKFKTDKQNNEISAEHFSSFTSAAGVASRFGQV